MRLVSSTVYSALIGAFALASPMGAIAGDLGTQLSVSGGFASHQGLKFSDQGQALSVGHVATLQQSLSVTKPLLQRGPLTVDLSAEAFHESGTAKSFDINGTLQAGDAKFARIAAYANLRASYQIAQVTPYVGVGLGTVSDRFSIPLGGKSYRNDYLAGKAYIGAEYRLENGFGVDVRATSVKSFE